MSRIYRAKTKRDAINASYRGATSMQVSSLSATPVSLANKISDARSDSRVTAAVVGNEQAPGVSKQIDFSNITPRQLMAYIDQRIFSNTIDPDEASGITNQLSATQYFDAPDVPFDLRARLNGCSQYSQQTGSPLAAWYEQLGKRLDIMEAQSVHLSVVA